MVERKRPQTTTGKTKRINTGCGYLYITINYVEGEDRPLEIFAILGKAGGCAMAQIEALTRMVTLSLRSGVDPADIVKHLRGIRCPSRSIDNNKNILSCADAISQVLAESIGLDISPPVSSYQDQPSLLNKD